MNGAVFLAAGDPECHYPDIRFDSSGHASLYIVHLLFPPLSFYLSSFSILDNPCSQGLPMHRDTRSKIRRSRNDCEDRQTNLKESNVEGREMRGQFWKVGFGERISFGRDITMRWILLILEINCYFLYY